MSASPYLTIFERMEIEALLMEGHSIKTIAEMINRSSATVSRDVRRGGGRLKYNAQEVQAKIDKYIGIKHPETVNKSRLDNLEMQVEILTDTIKQIKEKLDDIKNNGL